MSMQPLAALRTIAELRADAIVVPTMTTVAPWHEISPSVLNVSCIGFMGGASALGLGLALAQPERRVIVLDGDGSLLMNLGSLVTIANVAPKNLVHCLCQNGTYETNGAVPIPGVGRVDFPALARAAGYPRAYAFDALGDWEQALPALLCEEGPIFVDLHVEPGDTRFPNDFRRLYSVESREAFRRALAAQPMPVGAV